MVHDIERSGYELARIVREDNLGRGVLGAYAQEGDSRGSSEDRLIAAALVTWPVDRPRQM